MNRSVKQIQKRRPKRFLARTLCAALLCGILLSALASCGGPKEQKEELLVWVAEEVVDFTKTECARFLSEHPDLAERFTVKVSAMGEGETATQMLTDVASGADVYAFAQDQLARLVRAGALSSLGGDYLKAVQSENDAGSVTAVTVGEKVYAYPLTSDNGYFLYYDKSVVKDPSRLTSILADCKAAGKRFYMDNQSGWYLVSFFFGTGCVYETESNDAGEITKVTCDFDSDAGLSAMKVMIDAVKSGAFQRSDSFASQFGKDGGLAGAAISGVWDAAAIRGHLGSDYGVAKLPTMTVGGEERQMGAWAGYKLLGVNPTQSDEAVVASHRLAAYLTSEAVQLRRYEAKGWGPSNKAAQSSSAVQSDEALTALREQLAFSPPQPQCSANFWAKMEALGTEINAGTYNAASDDELRAVLKSLAEELRSDVVK